MQELLLELIAHMRWADALVAAALIDEPASRGATADPEAVRLFAHVASVEHLWYARILSRTPDLPVWPSLTPEQSRDLAAQHADLYDDLIESGDVLEKIVSYTNSQGKHFKSSVRHIVTHVTAHGSYHRGQIARAIRSAGGEPPYTDFIQYTRRDQI